MASETATAQQIKSQFASLRLGEMKDDMSRFARELLRMKAEVICSKYQPETILQMSGIANTPDAMLAPQAIAMLKDEPVRNFNIDIETDTLVELDQQSEKQARVEFLTAAGGFLKEAVTAGMQAPQLSPLLMQMLLFGIRGFRVGRELEGEFEKLGEQMQGNPQQPQGQGQGQETGTNMMDAQIEQGKMQATMQIEQAKAQVDLQKHQMDLQSKGEIERMKEEYESARNRERIAADIQIAQIQANARIVDEANSQSKET